MTGMGWGLSAAGFTGLRDWTGLGPFRAEGISILSNPIILKILLLTIGGRKVGRREDGGCLPPAMIGSNIPSAATTPEIGLGQHGGACAGDVDRGGPTAGSPTNWRR